MPNIHIEDHACLTRFGPGVFGNIIGDTEIFSKKCTRLERLAVFLEDHPSPERWACTRTYPQLFKKLGITSGLSEFPTSFHALCDAVTEIPTWFIAGADGGTSLVACLLVRAPQGLLIRPAEANESPNRLFLTEGTFPPRWEGLADLRHQGFSKEQQWLFALMGASIYHTSPHFSYKTVGILHPQGLSVSRC